MGESILKQYRLMPPGNPCAVWSVIAGVAGFCVPFLGGVAAIGLGIAGIVQSRRSLTGRGAAVAGLLLGVVSVVLYLALWRGVAGTAHWFGTPHPAG